MEISDLEARVKTAEPNGNCKVNINHGSGNEGIWGCFCTPEDRATYDRNKAGEEFQVFLLNHALIGGPTWGARLKLTSSGNDIRSSIPVAKVIEQMNEAVQSGDYPTADKFK